MSGKGQQTIKGNADGNPNHHVSPPTLASKHNEGPNEQVPYPAVYWSVIHHKNVHEGVPSALQNIDSTRQNVASPKESIDNSLKNDLLGTKQGDEIQFRKRMEQLPVHSSIPEVIHEHERQPFISEISTRSALTDYESTSVSPPFSPDTLLQQSSRSESRWSRVKDVVDSKELFIRHNSGVSGSTKKWSDSFNIQYEFTLRECLIVFLALLATGALAYSFIFEQWSILDSLYFTTVLLTTVGYGDITPHTVGGKLFASVFALGGVVVLGLILGVVGSQLVEAEIGFNEKVKSKTSRALEAAFTSRRHRRREKENIEHFIETGEKTLSRSNSASSMESIESESTCSSVHDPDSPTHSLSSKRGYHPSDEKPPKKCLPGLSVIKRHLPGFAPMIVGGAVMALIERWGWHDAIYYCVVTATTIGFGDLTPGTPLGKCCAILFVPIVVAAMGYILGNVATFIVEQRRDKYNKRLWSGEMKIEDIEKLDEARDGGVSELEYIKFMLVAMNKVDGALFNDLRDQFRLLDMTGDGKITKKDLEIMATRKMRKVSHKMKLYQYKHRLTRQGNKGAALTTAVVKMLSTPKHTNAKQLQECP